MRTPVCAVAALIGLGMVLCSAGCGAGTEVAPDPLLNAIAAGDAPHILDVRTSREYLAGHVPGAVHVPYHEIWLRQADLPAAKTDPIVVYCSHGPRAGLAAFQLWTLGYEHIAFLAGQMTGWKRRGLPEETGGEP